MASAVALPESGSYIRAVRETCDVTRREANILVNQSDVDHFLLSLDEKDYERLKDAHGLSGMPLNFSSPLEELNVISMLSILNFLHCYRLALHEKTGRGAWQTIRRFVLFAFLGAESNTSLLSARGMKIATVAEVASAMEISLHTEKPHDHLPIKIGEVDPVAEEIVGKVVNVLQSTGQVLINGGYSNLGEFVAEALRDGKGSAEILVERVVRAFPAFQDLYHVNGKVVYLFKKAFFLVYAIHQTFSKPGKAAPFPIPNIDALPIFSDNVIPTMMVHFRLIDISQSTNHELSRGLFDTSTSATAQGTDGHDLIQGTQLSPQSAGTIRASAVSASTIIVERALELSKSAEGTSWLSRINELGLDAYLWAVAKDTNQLRGIARFIEMGTIMY